MYVHMHNINIHIYIYREREGSREREREIDRSAASACSAPSAEAALQSILYAILFRMCLFILMSVYIICFIVYINIQYSIVNNVSVYCFICLFHVFFMCSCYY